MEILTLEELEERKTEVKDYFWFCWNFQDPEGWMKSDFGMGIAHAALRMTQKFIRLSIENGGDIPDDETIIGLYDTVFLGVMTDLEILGEDEASMEVVFTIMTGQRPE